MKYFALLLLIIIATALLFAPITTLDAEQGKSTATQLLGMPILGVFSDRTCWLSIGMGTGVVFVGIVGAGGVAIALAAGAGLLFAIGQAAAGMMVFGQLGIGLVFSISQLGTGATGMGQLIAGVLVKGQLELGKDGGEFLRHLRDDMNKVLAFR